jgi:hypothetical protein
MAPDAKKNDLLYVSDTAHSIVFVYSYPKGKFMGQLTGFQGPQAECVDNAGNVWITNEQPPSIIEYAHGGTTPIATLSDANEDPLDCSVNPKTGDLAVMNFVTSNGPPGSVSIYSGAKGTPKTYSDPNINLMYFGGYDPKGNLFVDAISGGGAFTFAELPRGKKTFTNIPLNQSFSQPGGVLWDGKYVTVGDSIAEVIYQTTGAGGTIVGSTSFTGATGVFQFWLQGKTAIGPVGTNGHILFYPYPAGGSPTKTIIGNSGEASFATISRAKT